MGALLDNWWMGHMDGTHVIGARTTRRDPYARWKGTGDMVARFPRHLRVPQSVILPKVVLQKVTEIGGSL